jgi:heterodisulfide reductase subunit A-like polyferredoxin
MTLSKNSLNGISSNGHHTMTQHVGVIGSGLAGLAAACTLAARGHRVEVFEKNAWLGGKAAQLNEKGFRFDMGPTILIQPSVLRKTMCRWRGSIRSGAASSRTAHGLI